MIDRKSASSPNRAWRADERRTALLLFSEELRSGRLSPADVDLPAVREAVGTQTIPSPARRAVQRLRMKRGTLAYEDATVGRYTSARRAVLGDEASGPPRFLIRVDEFPHYMAGDQPQRFGSDQFARFHGVMTEAGAPYLIAVVPRVPERPLDPGHTGYRRLDDTELEQLARLRDDGVAFALHGLDHRTRDAHPRRHSEIAGLPPVELEALLDTALAELAEAGIAPRVFVPPYNRFDVSQYGVLARRFDVVCGGPENVLAHGFAHTPAWRSDAVWLPAYAPLYDRAAAVGAAVERLSNAATALWTPIVLHWGWEADDDWQALRKLAGRVAAMASSWDRFLEATDSVQRLSAR